jgi:subtilisin family serine protease
MKNKTGINIIIVAAILFTVFSVVTPVGYAEATTVEVIVGFACQPDAEVIRQYGGEVHHVYSIISAVYASLPETAIELLRKDPKITYVDLNNHVEAIGQTMPWGIDRINVPQAWAQSSGEGVKIAILDTGVGPHPDITVYGGYDFVNNDADPSDDNGHGTHVAGTLAAVFNDFGVVGVAPQAHIYSVKILGSDGKGNSAWAIQGIEWAVNNDVQIISMSWNASNTWSLRAAVNNAYNSGILLIAAAGNENNKVAYPAADESVIAVSATKQDNTRADFSGVGSAVELAAPGVDINSTWLNDGYAVMSGTSMATPHVSGVAALVWAKNPALTNIEVRRILQDSAVDLDVTGRDIYYGYGFVDAHAAILATPSAIEADFTWSPSTVYAGGTVTFDASASSSQHSIITGYTWDFGDGNNATLNTPIATHTYASAGSFDVTLTVHDEFGFSNSTSKPVRVLQDEVPPVTAANYDGSWQTTDFTITLVATDNESGVKETYYRINNETIKTARADGHPVITSEGANNTLEYWSVDNAGNVEPPNILTDIKLDKTAPEGSVIINGGAAYTTSPTVTLTLSAEDTISGVFQVRYSNEETWDNAPWEPFSETKTWNLTADDGTKTVYVQFIDKAGLVSAVYSDTITLDTNTSGAVNGSTTPPQEDQEQEEPPTTKPPEEPAPTEEPETNGEPEATSPPEETTPEKPESEEESFPLWIVIVSVIAVVTAAVVAVLLLEQKEALRIGASRFHSARLIKKASFEKFAHLINVCGFLTQTKFTFSESAVSKEKIIR